MTKTFLPVGNNTFAVNTETLAVIQHTREVPEKRIKEEVHIFDEENGEYSCGFSGTSWGFDVPHIVATLEQTGCKLVPVPGAHSYEGILTSWINPNALQFIAVEKINDKFSVMINMKSSNYIRTELPADQLKALMDGIHDVRPDMLRVESKDIRTTFSGYKSEHNFAEFNAADVEAIQVHNETQRISREQVHLLTKTGIIEFEIAPDGEDYFDIQDSNTFKRMKRLADLLKIDTQQPAAQSELRSRASDYAKNRERRLTREFTAQILAKAPALVQIPGAKKTSYINPDHVVWARAGDNFAGFVLQRERRSQIGSDYDLKAYFETPADAHKALAILPATPKP